MKVVKCPECSKVMGPGTGRDNKTKTRRTYHCPLCGFSFEKKV